jgi:hypothetical protein
MAVNISTVVNMGAASLVPGEFLLYSLFPSAGNPIWSFSCSDRKGIFQVSETPKPEYKWAIINGPPPNPLHVPIDRDIRIADVYAVFLIFAQVQSYRLTVVKKPINLVIQDITLTAQLRTDTFPVILGVTGT